jgi:hypothetical protein
MPEPSPDQRTQDALSGSIDSWRDFGDRVSAALAVAAVQGGSLMLVDADFAAWPLGQRSVVEAFQQWALGAGGGRCQLLAADFATLPVKHPRWAAWRPRWAHRVVCHQAPPELASSLWPTLIVEGCVGLRLLESRVGRGVWSRDVPTLRAWQREVDVILQRSDEALPPTVLGL